MADLIVAVPKLLDQIVDSAGRGQAVAVLSMNVYCWPHRAVHTLSLNDVEALVYTLGVMAVDGYQLGDGEQPHAQDCPLDVLRLGHNPEGYAEHVEQGVVCRVALLVDELPAGELLDADRRGQLVDGSLDCPECRSGKCGNCSEVAFDVNDRQVDCPCNDRGHVHIGRPE